MRRAEKFQLYLILPPKLYVVLHKPEPHQSSMHYLGEVVRNWTRVVLPPGLCTFKLLLYIMCDLVVTAQPLLVTTAKIFPSISVNH